jgi:cytochrome c oxidase subunit 3
MPPAWGSAWAGTMFLLTSSWWISESKMQFVFGSSKKSLYCITATLWCGAMFLFIQQWEFLSIPLTINQACSASLFFILTGFHCLHVILGMLFILNLYYRIIVHKFFVYRQKSILFDITIWYWHFVDYVWIFLFLAVYCYIG